MTEKPPSSQAGGTASLGHPGCRDSGQPGHSKTHCVVYPPLLLQEQLVFTVVIVQALVQESEMLLPSSRGEEIPHPCIIFLLNLAPSPLKLPSWAATSPCPRYLTCCTPGSRAETEEMGTYLILERQELLVVGDLIGILPRELRLLQDVMHELGWPGPSPTLPSAA